MIVDQYAAERTMLATRDRDELNAIAAAMGVKGTTRLRKAEIVEAILTAAGAGVAIGEATARPRPSRKRALPKDPPPSTGGGEGESPAAVIEPTTNGPVTAPPPQPTAPAPAVRTPGQFTSPSLPGMSDPVSGRASTTSPSPAPKIDAPATSQTPSRDGEARVSAPLPPAPPSPPPAPAPPSPLPPSVSGNQTPGNHSSTTGITRTPEGSYVPAVPASPSPAGETRTPSLAGGRESQSPIRERPATNREAPPRSGPSNHPGQAGGGAPGGGARIPAAPTGSRPSWSPPGQGTGPAPGARGDGYDDGSAEGRGRRRRRRGRERPFETTPETRETREVREPRQYEPPGEAIDVQGLLEIRDEGYGFLRTGGYLPGARDIYVSASQVRRFGLRKGDFVKGATRPAASNEKYPALLRLDEINGIVPDDARVRARFEDLTPLFPDERLRLELPGEPDNVTGRIVDLISPIGKGQRGLIVSPPKAGKTTIMKQIAHSIERRNPEVHLIVLLVDERPEEVTDMRRHVQRGEVVASTFDRPSDEHTQVAELTIERAKRLVEMGKDVVIILDGITRLARAYNLAAPASGRILSGGVDSAALYPPKKFFGAARNVEEGGSLTILATALVETGSRMDEVIFEEFKGTGNMELRLDRRLSERRIYPSIDVESSSTRHEELLFDRAQLQQVWKLRRVLNALEGGAGLELLIDKIKTTRSNDEFLAEIAKAPSPGG